MIGEFIARLALWNHRRRQQWAREEARFNGICPRCGAPMEFVKRVERCAEGGAVNPGLVFECHGCLLRVWKNAWYKREDGIYDIAH